MKKFLQPYREKKDFTTKKPSIKCIGDRPDPRPKFKSPAEICPKSAGVLQNIFPKMYIILLENEGF